jgi:hypothetical protein
LDTLSTDPSILQAWTDVLENLPDAVFIVAILPKPVDVNVLLREIAALLGTQH